MIRFTAQLSLNKTSICPPPCILQARSWTNSNNCVSQDLFSLKPYCRWYRILFHLHVSLYYWREYAPWSCRQYMSVILVYSFQPLTFSLSWRLESHSLFPVIWYLGCVIWSSINQSQYRSYMYNVRQFPQYPWSNLIWASSFMYLLFM